MDSMPARDTLRTHNVGGSNIPSVRVGPVSPLMMEIGGGQFHDQTLYDWPLLIKESLEGRLFLSFKVLVPLKTQTGSEFSSLTRENRKGLTIGFKENSGE